MADEYWRVEVKPLASSAGWEVYPHVVPRTEEEGLRVLSNLANGQAYAARLAHYVPEVVASWERIDGQAAWAIEPEVALPVASSSTTPESQPAPSAPQARAARREEEASGRRGRR